MNKRTNSDWYIFQEEIKKYFESLGTQAETNVKLIGARGEHDIDILIRTKFLGRDVIWIIEAKKWKSNVPKEKVLALITIVQDIGADRGFIISEKGFQSGAIKVSENTNITLLTFNELKVETKRYINSEILKQYEERFHLLYSRYFSHSKETRNDYDLKGSIFFVNPPFSGNTQLRYIEKVIETVKKRDYPIDSDTGLKISAGEKQIEDFQQACNWLNLNLNLLDRELMEAEQKMFKFGDYKPKYEKLAETLDRFKPI